MEKVGHHFPVGKTMEETIKFVLENQTSGSSQVFFGSRQQYNRKKITEKDIMVTKDIIEATDHHMFFHAPYCLNLGNPEKCERCIEPLVYELQMAKKLGVKGVVLHPGSNPDKREGMKSISKNIAKILSIVPDYNRNCPLILEIPAGERNKIGTFKDLAKIRDQVKLPLALCIDTQHIFGSGKYDLRQNEQVIKMFGDAEKLFGEDIPIVHLNDSLVPFSKKVDRHARIGQGYIFHGQRNKYNCVIEDSSLGTIIGHCVGKGIDMVIE